jgi:NAD(P)-dependent dehydrogenase (short-subunit alcohol dehydrogenase family)
MKDVKGKVAFITGGASGIGLGAAKAFVAAGMKVVMGDVRQDHCDEAMAWFEERQQGMNVHAIKLDVTDRDACAARCMCFSTMPAWASAGRSRRPLTTIGIGALA